MLKETLNLFITIENSFEIKHNLYFKYFDTDIYKQVISIYQLGGRIYHGRNYAQRIYDYRGVDQFKKVESILEKKALAKSATIVLSNPSKDELHLPCIMDINFKIRDGLLLMTLVFKSSDLAKKFIPDLYSLSRLHAQLSRNLNVARGEIDIFIMSAQIYKSDYQIGTKLTQSRTRKYYKLNSEIKNWNEDATQWDKNLINPQHYVNIENGYKKFIDFMIKILDKQKIAKKDQCLDLGCGTGAITKLLTKYSSKVIGLDVADKMINIARKNILKAKFIIGNALDIPFNENEFSLIVSRGILISHIGKDYYQDYLKEVSRVIKPGGIFIFDFLANIKSDETKLRKKKAIFNQNKIKRALIQHQFKVIEISGTKTNRVNRVFCIKQ